MKPRPRAGGPPWGPRGAKLMRGMARAGSCRPQKKFAGTRSAAICRCSPVIKVGGGLAELHFGCSLPRACQV
eukprot:6620225-Pyramimonas_sp.AAC.1